MLYDLSTATLRDPPIFRNVIHASLAHCRLNQTGPANGPVTFPHLHRHFVNTQFRFSAAMRRA
jgi:hypothetical protein